MIVLTRHGNKNIRGFTENIRGFSPLSPPLAPPLVMTVFKNIYIVIAKFEFNSYACYISIRITYFKRLHVLVTHASSKTRHVQRFECGSEDDFREHFEPQVRSLLAHNFLSRPIQMLLATNFPVNVRWKTAKLTCILNRVLEEGYYI